MKILLHLVLIISSLFCTQILFAAPAGLTLQGRLVKDDIPITGAVTVTVSVRTPNSDLCYLFEETHSLTLATADGGVFSVAIGTGTRTGNDKGFSLINVFSNTGNAINSLVCPGTGATAYTPLSSHSRYVYLSFDTTVGTVAFNDPYVVQSVPYALEAEKLAGKSSSDFVQTIANLESTPGTTQTRMTQVLDTDYSVLNALLNGTSIQYMTSSTTAGTNIPVLSSQPATLTAGKMWYEGGALKYYDGASSSVKTLGTTTGSVVNGGQAGALAIGTSDANSLTLSTNNTAKMTILSNGNIGVGTTAPFGAIHINNDNVSDAADDVWVTTYSNAASPALIAIRARGNQTTPTPTLSGDTLFTLSINGYNGSANRNAATIKAVATSDFNTSPIADLMFHTNNGGAGSSERMRITGAGNVGIGAVTPNALLHLNKDTDSHAILKLTNSISGNASTDGFDIITSSTDASAHLWQRENSYMRFYTNNLSRMSITAAGSVGIGTGSPGAALDITNAGTTTSAIIVPRAGNFTGTTANGMIRYNTASNLFEFYQSGAWVNYTTPSDGRLKSKVVPVTDGLGIVNQLNPVFYDWDKNNPRTKSFRDKHEVGFIAQEVEKVLPEVVDQGEDSYRSVQYGKIVAVVVAAVKELYNQFLGHDERLAILESENAALKAYICGKDPGAAICK